MNSNKPPVMDRAFCRTCGESFDPRSHLGQWQCRIHVTPTRQVMLRNPPTRGYGHVYTCCGLGYEEEQWSTENVNLYLDRAEIRGCVPVDHIESTSPHPRRVDDLHLVPLLTVTTPPEILMHAPGYFSMIAVTYADVSAGSVALEYKRTYPVAGSKTPHQIDFTARLRTIVEMAYGDPRFQQDRGMTDAIRFRTPTGRQSVVTPREDPDIYERLYGPASARMTDTEFVKLYYMLAHPDAIFVTVVILRAAAPAPSPTTLEHVRLQFEHWERKNLVV